GGALDPESATPEGARAVARVLADRGVAVQRVTTVDDATTAAAGGATLVVVDSTVLSPDRLDDLAATTADLVLVEPDAVVLGELAPALVPAGIAPAVVRPAGCADTDAAAAGEALAGGHLVRAVGDATVCFADEQDREAGSYAVTEVDGREVTVIGQAGVLTNEHLGDDGNAALALRSLGANERLVWLMASPLDTTADEEPALTDLLPRWVGWTALWLVVVAVLAIVWRARRLGRLVPEALPVVVRSAETAEGRASLYRAAGAYDRAALVLRAATLRRLAARLGLPASSSGDAVAAQVARATRRDPEAVRGLLLGPPPADPRALVVLADDLDRLAADLHDTTAQPGRPAGSDRREGAHR
ncbi:MAG: DUF4350 domain-containing protein, partial [Actinomycetes bacterium]